VELEKEMSRLTEQLQQKSDELIALEVSKKAVEKELADAMGSKETQKVDYNNNIEELIKQVNYF